ncbi:MAG: radical SAM protein [Planctomycetes bacterium]|nr:radical SAM protein [Planctomycetota bacterium]
MLRRIKRMVWGTTPVQRTVEHLRAVRLRKTHPEGIAPPLPERVVVEPTNACNLSCTYCGNKDMVRPHTYLRMDLFERLLDEMVELGIPRCTLHTIGEPLLHPRIAEMIRMAKDRNRVVTMSTNGTLLREQLARDIVHAGPDMLHVSADAADADVLAQTRCGLKVETLLRGLRTLRRLRDAEGPVRDSPWGRVRLPTPAITCVVTPLFTRDVERRFFETFAPLVDDVVFHFANNHAGYVTNEPALRRELLPNHLRRWFYRRLRRPCFYPWDTLYLLSDGTVSVCRFDFDARVRIGRYQEMSLPELWNSAAMASLRRAHMFFDFRDWTLCQDCSGMLYENRHEHWALTKKLKRRNGMVATRDCWQPINPLGVAPGSTAVAARPNRIEHLE